MHNLFASVFLLFAALPALAQSSIQSFFVIKETECSSCLAGKNVLLEEGMELNPRLVLPGDQRKNIELIRDAYLGRDWADSLITYNDSLYNSLSESVYSLFVVVRNGRMIFKCPLKALPTHIGTAKRLLDYRFDTISTASIPLSKQQSISAENGLILIQDKSFNKIYLYDTISAKFSNKEVVNLDKSMLRALVERIDQKNFTADEILAIYEKEKASLPQPAKIEAARSIEGKMHYLVSLQYPHSKEGDDYIGSVTYFYVKEEDNGTYHLLHLAPIKNFEICGWDGFGFRDNELLVSTMHDTDKPPLNHLATYSLTTGKGGLIKHSLPKYYIDNKLYYNYTGKIISDSLVCFHIATDCYDASFQKIKLPIQSTAPVTNPTSKSGMPNFGVSIQTIRKSGDSLQIIYMDETNGHALHYALYDIGKQKMVFDDSIPNLNGFSMGTWPVFLSENSIAYLASRNQELIILHLPIPRL